MKISDDKLQEIMSKILDIFKDEKLHLLDVLEVSFNLIISSALASNVPKERFLNLLIKANNHYIDRFNRLTKEKNDTNRHTE